MSPALQFDLAASITTRQRKTRDTTKAQSFPLSNLFVLCKLLLFPNPSLISFFISAGHGVKWLPADELWSADDENVNESVISIMLMMMISCCWNPFPAATNHREIARYKMIPFNLQNGCCCFWWSWSSFSSPPSLISSMCVHERILISPWNRKETGK